MSNTHIHAELETYKKDLESIRPQLVKFNENYCDNNQLVQPGIVTLTAVDGLLSRLKNPAALAEDDTFDLGASIKLQDSVESVLNDARLLTGALTSTG